MKTHYFECTDVKNDWLQTLEPKGYSKWLQVLVQGEELWHCSKTGSTTEEKRPQQIVEMGEGNWVAVKRVRNCEFKKN